MMEISPWLIYWLMQLDSICKFVDIVAFFGALILFLTTAVRIGWKTEDCYGAYKKLYEITTPYYKIISVIVPIFILVNIFIPNTKTVAAMLVVPPIVKNEQMQQLPEELLTFVRSIIKEHVYDNKDRK